jgi:hypothetical protein
MLADPEPTIRLQTLISMMRSGGDLAAEALQRSKSEPPQERQALIREAIQVATPPFSARTLIEETEGDLRQLVYHELLRPDDDKIPLNEERHPVQVVRLGLERGDPEMLRAAFAPDLVRIQPRWRYGALMQPKGLSPQPPALFQTRLAAAPDTDLTARLIRAAAESPDVNVRRAVPAFFNTLPSKKGLEFYADLVGRDPSPQVRTLAIELDPPTFSHDVALQLMLEGSGIIAEAAIKRCDDPRLLAEVARQVDSNHFDVVLGRAREIVALDAVRELYARAGADSRLIADCFDLLVVQNIDVAVDALDSPSRSVRLRAVARLRELPGLPPELETLLAGEDVLKSRPEIVNELRAKRDSIRQLFRRKRINDLVALAKAAGPNSADIGRQLAELGAKEELRALLGEASVAAMAAGAYGLVALGDKEPIAEALRLVPNPSS